MDRPRTSTSGWPLSVSTLARTLGWPPIATKRRMTCATAMSMTSTGNGKRPSTSTRLDSSAMQTNLSARSATIFSRVNAAPPPLIMQPRASISSAPST